MKNKNENRKRTKTLKNWKQVAPNLTLLIQITTGGFVITHLDLLLYI